MFIICLYLLKISKIIYMSLNIFRDYTPSSRIVGSPGDGNRWINLGVSIPYLEKENLKDHIVQCGRSNQYLNEIKKGPYGLLLPTPQDKIIEFKQHLISIAESLSYFDPKLKEEFINKSERGVDFAIDSRDQRGVIVGLDTHYGLPTLTVDEVEALRICMQSYKSINSIEASDIVHISELDWKENAYDEFIDPVSLELLIDPVIASDGYTYSKQTLISIFRTNKISPMTREQLVPIGKMNNSAYFTLNNQELGISNIKVKQLLDKLKAGKLKASQNKYLKYKSKYIRLKNSLL